MEFDKVKIALLIVLVLFVISSVICEYFGCNLICGKNKQIQVMSRIDDDTITVLSTKKLLHASIDGMIRGLVLGGLTGSVGAATAYAVSLGVLNPTMLIGLYRTLPSL